jgi:uncharacterized protein
MCTAALPVFWAPVLRSCMRLGLPVALALVLTRAGTAQQPAHPPEIVAAGEGEARVTPDRVYADVAVETTAPTAATAASDNAASIRVIREALQRAGATPASISDVGFEVRAKTRYDQGTERPEGYQAIHTLRVETAALDRIGSLIDAALAAGANRVQNVRYSSTTLETARRAAITAAVGRARADAEAMAGAAGGTLGQLVELTTSRFGAPPGVLIQEQAIYARTAEDTSISPRELVLRATVLARWAFVPK